MLDFRDLFAGKGEKAVRYMNKKYGKAFGDEFAIKDAEYAGFTSRADNYLMTSKRFPDVYIRVSYFEREYDTDYMEFHFYKQYQEFMQPICEEVLGECKVLMRFSLSPTCTLNEKTTFQKFMKTDEFGKNAIIFIKDETGIHEKAEKLIERIKEIKVPHCCLRFIILKNYEDAKSFESDVDWGKYQETDAKQKLVKHYDFSLDKNYEVWDKGEGDWYL